MEEVKEKIRLLKVEDIEELTGWCRPTILKLMDQPEFPAIKIGKENQVEADAFKQYLMQRRELRGA